MAKQIKITGLVTTPVTISSNTQDPALAVSITATGVLDTTPGLTTALYGTSE